MYSSCGAVGVVYLIYIYLYIPERATNSLAVKPLFEKKVIRSVRLRIGDGS